VRTTTYTYHSGSDSIEVGTLRLRRPSPAGQGTKSRRSAHFSPSGPISWQRLLRSCAPGQVAPWFCSAASVAYPARVAANTGLPPGKLEDQMAACAFANLRFGLLLEDCRRETLLNSTSCPVSLCGLACALAEGARCRLINQQLSIMRTGSAF
jgi:hypothetical protein